MHDSIPPEGPSPAVPQAPPSTRSCPRCFSALPLESKFCTKCGFAIARWHGRRGERGRFREAFGACKYIILFYILMLAAIWSQIPGDSDEVVSKMIVADVISVALIVVFWRKSRFSIGYLFKPQKGYGVTMAALMLLLLTLSLTLNFLYHSFLTSWLQLESGEAILDAFVDNGYGFGMGVLMICVMPGIWEEISFRGLIQEALLKTLGPGESIVISGILFSIIHVSYLSAPYLCFLGIVLAWLRWKSGSIYPGMVLHFLHNLAVIFAEYYSVF